MPETLLSFVEIVCIVIFIYVCVLECGSIVEVEVLSKLYMGGD